MDTLKVKGIVKKRPIRRGLSGQEYYEFFIENEEKKEKYKCKSWDGSLFGILETLVLNKEIEISGNLQKYFRTYDNKTEEYIKISNIIENPKYFDQTQKQQDPEDGQNMDNDDFPFTRLKKRFSRIEAMDKSVAKYFHLFEMEFSIQREKICNLFRKNLKKLPDGTSDFYDALYKFSLWDIILLSVFYKLIYNDKKITPKEFIEAKSIGQLRIPLYGSHVASSEYGWTTLGLLENEFLSLSITKETLEKIIRKKMNRLNKWEANILWIIAGKIKEKGIDKETFLSCG